MAQLHRYAFSTLAVASLLIGCDKDNDSTVDPVLCAGWHCAGAGAGQGGSAGGAVGGASGSSASGSSGRSASTAAGSGGTLSTSAGRGGSGGSQSAGAGSSGSGPTAGSSDNGGSGGNAGTDEASAGSAGSDSDGTAGSAGEESPPVPNFTLVVDSPQSGASVSDKVTLRGRAPGFKNVEVWDAMHQNPPLAQVVPGSDGRFEVEVDVAALAAGTTTWTVHAWDSAPGQSFTNTDSVTLELVITAGGNPSGCSGQTCSGHGRCSESGGSATCTCDSGFHAVGLSCVANSTGNDGTPDPGARYVPTGYNLVFNDEFDGTTLDTGKWNTLGPWGVQFFADSKQKQAFVPEAVTQSGGILTFTAKPSNGSNTNGQPYSSGSITTNRTFTHGYFEARVKVPAGKGFWPAYWLTSSDRWPPEWDIFEIINNVIYGYPHPIQSGTCRFVEGAAGGDSTYTINNLYGIYHVYGFRWTASDIYWYVDGVLTEHYAINAAAGANDPYWLNISFQIGGDWPGDPDGSTPFPAHMDVDYMRVYQQN